MKKIKFKNILKIIFCTMWMCQLSIDRWYSMNGFLMNKRCGSTASIYCGFMFQKKTSQKFYSQVNAGNFVLLSVLVVVCVFFQFIGIHSLYQYWTESIRNIKKPFDSIKKAAPIEWLSIIYFFFCLNRSYIVKYRRKKKNTSTDDHFVW